ncbi:hypothetical protein KAW65_00370 [candidate division WOR-3 bacterium]|nr:hypothetical protein [candidate division WOR-3 bacterium]
MKYCECDVPGQYILIVVDSTEEFDEKTMNKINGIVQHYNITSKNGVCFLHNRKSPLYDIPEGCDDEKIPTKEYAGFQSYPYCLLDLIFFEKKKMYEGREECSKFPSWEEILIKFESNWEELIFSPFLPLHLSLQAFFGISRDENGEFVKVGTRTEIGDAEEQKILNSINVQREKLTKERKLKDGNQDLPDKYKKTFPNPDAFLLVDEAQWDFYASTFDKIMPPNKCVGIRDGCKENRNEEKEEYDKDKKIALLLEKFISHIKGKDEKDKLSALKIAISNEFGEEANHKSDGPIPANYKIKIPCEEIGYDNFVKTLRELCAILANTPARGDPKDCKNKKGIFVYKGKCDKERDEILEQIRGINGNNLDRICHCKLEERVKDKNCSYEVLRNQIADWGIWKVMRVIAGIEELAKILDDAIKCHELD